MGKKDFKSISTFISTFNTDIVNVVIIDVDIYSLAWKLKKAQVFAVSIKNLEFQAKKKV